MGSELSQWNHFVVSKQDSVISVGLARLWVLGETKDQNETSVGDEDYQKNKSKEIEIGGYLGGGAV